MQAPDRFLRYGLIAPALVLVIGTTLWPVVSAVTTSLRDWRLKRSSLPQKWVGFDNYLVAFEEPEFWNAVKVTTTFVILDVLLTVCLALAVALLLRRAGVLQSLVRAVIILPFAVSPALIGVSFRFMLNGEHGVLARGFAATFPWLSDVVWLATPGYAMAALIASDVWHWFPYLTLMFLGGLAAIPKETEEAAELDGANGLQMIFLVILPQIRSIIAVGAILKTIFALKMFDQVATLTGGGPGITTQTLAHYTYAVGFVHYDMGLASALAVILTAILVTIGIFYIRLVLPQREHSAP
ncbi:MAG TPA: sugar ABC transporter permease [Beijerinckiaceae bacterium]|nr:sugar ABC transporter permease [Beijerinckiaceae bacterium]